MSCSPIFPFSKVSKGDMVSNWRHCTAKHWPSDAPNISRIFWTYDIISVSHSYVMSCSPFTYLGMRYRISCPNAFGCSLSFQSMTSLWSSQCMKMMLKMSDARLLTPHPYVTGPYLKAHLWDPPSPPLLSTHQSFLCPNTAAISHLYWAICIYPLYHQQVNRSK